MRGRENAADNDSLRQSVELFLVPSSKGAGCALRVWLTGSQQWRGGEPLSLGRYSDAAYDRIRQDYPLFAYRLAKETGLLGLPGWDRRIAAYWLIPFSEKSPLRTRLINHLYRLFLVEAAIQAHSPAELILTSDDAGLVRLMADLGRKHGLSVAVESPGQESTVRRSSRWEWSKRVKSVAAFAWRALRQRVGLIKSQWLIWRLLRGQAEAAMAQVARSGRPLIAFFTRYPILWENPGEEWARERNFGTFPEFMSGRGYEVTYPSVLSLSGAELRNRLSEVLGQAQCLRLVFLESLLTFREFVIAHLNFSHVWRYLRWRVGLGSRPVYFDGVDVKDLVLRDLDDDFLFNSDIALNIALAYALRRFCRALTPRLVCYPFEFQPMERAVYAGIKAGSPETATVGVEPCVFMSSLLGYVYAPGEVAPERGSQGFHQAPLPDYLASYGTLFHETLSRQCAPQRLLLTGAIRYPEIQAESGVEGPSPTLNESDEIKLLVIGSPFREETMRLLEAAVELCRIRPEVFLLLKFHYHAPMFAEWERLANEAGCTRYKVFDTDLISLLRTSSATLLGSTSSVAEAIAVGCMPIVLHVGDEFTHCPARDIREATFFCWDTASVVEAVGACVNRTQAYWVRRHGWPDALEKMFYRLDGRQNERLLDGLRSRGVL